MNKAQILLISESQDLSLMICNLLESADYQVKTVFPDGVKKSFLKAFSLILFDYSLGNTAAEKAVKTGLPVIFIIRDESYETVNNIYVLGGCDFIVLPIIKGLLIARINSQLHLIKGRQNIEEANNELYDFCMPASHDLKAPFATISAFMDVLKEELKDCGSERADKLIATIDSNSTFIKTFIEDHYEHARAESFHRGGYIRILK